MRCSVPAHARPLVAPVGWLKDERELTHVLSASAWPSAPEAHESERTNNNNNYKMPVKHAMLATGELYIANASQADAGAYRCRVRQLSSGQVLTSDVAGRLIVKGKFATIYYC
ncbi:hypothetical protein GZH46_00892, partial [Fragariocoptes setiger]